MITMTRYTPNALLATAIFLALSTGAVFAQAPNANPGHGPAQPINLGPMDQNRDGKISADEAKSASTRTYTQIDADHNGNITASELKAEEEHVHLAELNRYLQSLDSDHDGKVTAAEFAAMDGERFKQIDRNKDGVISQDEIRPSGQ